MNKQAYFTMMKMACLNKKAEADVNTLGPLLGILGMGYLGKKLSEWIHGDDVSGWTQAAYMTPAMILGERLGNSVQNTVGGTDKESLLGSWISQLFSGTAKSRKDKEEGPEQKPIESVFTNQKSRVDKEPFKSLDRTSKIRGLRSHKMSPQKQLLLFNTTKKKESVEGPKNPHEQD